MSSESCERCGAAAPAALLRNVSLNVDGSEVDSQTICPDCFADWITHYQEQMAGNMTGVERTGNDTGALSETVRAASERADDSASDQHLQDAVEEGATSATPPGQGGVDDAGGAGGQTTTSGGNEIREVGSGSSGSDAVEVDLSGEAAVAEEEDDEDDDGLLLG